MKRILIAVCLLALSPQAFAACAADDRPAVPTIHHNPPPRKITGKTSTYELSWGFSAQKKLDDLMYWDISIQRTHDKFVLYQGGGVGDGARHHGGRGGPASLYWNVEVQTIKRADYGTFCLYLKTRTERGTEGCVSPGAPVVACKEILYSPRAVGRRKKLDNRDRFRASPGGL